MSKNDWLLGKLTQVAAEHSAWGFEREGEAVDQLRGEKMLPSSRLFSVGYHQSR
jgi:hypothetical protein